jgi:hypothetical protein
MRRGRRTDLGPAALREAHVGGGPLQAQRMRSELGSAGALKSQST